MRLSALGDIAQGAVLPAFCSVRERTPELTALISDDPVKLKEHRSKNIGFPTNAAITTMKRFLLGGHVDAAYLAMLQ